MGVPSYFRELIKKYGNIILNKRPAHVTSLYIDANCLFHPQCFKVLDKHLFTSGSALFDLMVAQIITYIKHLLSHVQPSKLVYIAVDGVAPLAKINQQRRRRFGYANNYKSRLNKKYNVPFNDTWSNIVITPGTEFMQNLHVCLTKFVDSLQEQEYLTIYDSYLNAGEGEHKIIAHIKRYGSDKGTVIYGLDADLIFLSMTCRHKNLYLLRETSEINIVSTNTDNEALLFVDIDTAKQAVYIDITSHMKPHLYAQVTQQKFVDDYIFICYFLGNDFLPHLPSIDINIHGLDIIIATYIDVYINFGKHLVSVDNSVDNSTKITINSDILLSFLSHIAQKEQHFFKVDLASALLKAHTRQCYETSPHKKEIWELENLVNVCVQDPVMLGIGDIEEQKERYYDHYFKTFEHRQDTVNKLCENYIEGIVWVTKYYFDKCPSWRWQYKYNHPPFLSDVVSYLRTKDISLVTLPLDTPVDINSNLVAVVPPELSMILPENLRDLCTSENSPVIDMFPTSYDIDMLYKTKLYKCIPIIPYLDIQRIEAAVKAAFIQNT